MAITKIYKGTAELADVLKIYKGSELVYEKEVEPSYPANVVVFKSDSPRTITPRYTQSGITLQYSIDSGLTWNNISSGATTASSDEIWFRGCATGAKRLYTSNVETNAWVFSGDASNKLHVYGDLRYLLCNSLGDNTITFNIASYCFASMFRGCTSLTTAPDLPATTLAKSCFYGMFMNCTSLTTAPSLPATTMADYCYSYMFYGCTSLTTAPNLPATTLASYCYSYMFYGCTSLTTAPELPATTIADNCYYGMFYGCTSLTTAPELPATTLADNCYTHMFNGCTSLTTAPSLPATTLAKSCFYGMFMNCTSLTTAPSLPVTTLAFRCYTSMFRGCTSLTTAPNLPATTLASYCYDSMFYGCTAFKVSKTKAGSYQYSWRLPTSGTGTTAGATSWNDSMLKNTGGPYTSDPTFNTTYYVENPPV
jgi:hypothetical protein